MKSTQRLSDLKAMSPDQLQDPPPVDLPTEEGLDHGQGRSQAEVAGHHPGQRGPRPAAVLAP